MGESVAEATITTWLKEVGDTIELDDAIVEIATDKVDSEVPSEVEGVLIEKLFEVDDVVQVGQVIAVIETEANGTIEVVPDTINESINNQETPEEANVIEAQIAEVTEEVTTNTNIDFEGGTKFYSPLVKNIAATEGITISELESIEGTGKDSRVTKKDILQYVADRKSGKVKEPVVTDQLRDKAIAPEKEKSSPKASPVVASGEDEII